MMARVRYVGLGNARAEFEALRPYRYRLIEMRLKCVPFGADYLVLDEAMRALDRAAEHFTRETEFYAAKPTRS